MATIGIFNINRYFPDLLERVSQGEEFSVVEVGQTDDNKSLNTQTDSDPIHFGSIQKTNYQDDSSIEEIIGEGRS
ncbi:hypothetical protein GF373_01915 [bacterium]|nr:hypothetical protein [bacterium]